MGIADKIMISSVFFKKDELSRPEFNMRLGRWFIRAEQTKEIARELEREGLIRIVKRNQQPFYQKVL